MPILKHFKNNIGYTQIPNVLAQNKSLSYEAIGLLVNLLSRPEEWVIHKSFLKTEKCGDTVINRIFKELQDFGYVKIFDVREGGKIVNRVWIASPVPMEPSALVNFESYPQDINRLSTGYPGISSENVGKTPQNLNDGKPHVEETSRWGNQGLYINNNINNNINKNKDNKYMSTCVDDSVDKCSDEIKSIFEYWKEKFNHHKSVLDAKRKTKIKNALKNYSISDLYLAIDGCSKSTFHNQGGYNDIELIMRDASHIDQFINYAKGVKNANSNKQSTNQYTKYTDFLDEVSESCQRVIKSKGN